jgi:hypothetical protein
MEGGGWLMVDDVCQKSDVIAEENQGRKKSGCEVLV